MEKDLEVASEEETGRERERERERERYGKDEIIASRGLSLIDSLNGNRRAAGSLPKIYALVFPKTSLAADVPARMYVLSFFDHAGRIDACVFPTRPSRNYLGRESSSLPRSFPSLLAIRGGYISRVGSRERGRRADLFCEFAITQYVNAAVDTRLFVT
jgi:hypothetical protein